MQRKQLLPLYKTKYGLEQRANFRHGDRYDEEVEDLDLNWCFKSLPKTASEGITLFTFLIVGDQNAGKSTFLHFFCNQFDPNFLRLMSFIPLISSSFVNSRFLMSPEIDEFTYKLNISREPQFGVREFEDKNEENLGLYCDEAPFLDTDIARGIFVLTWDDFLFLCEELGIGIEVTDKILSSGRSMLKLTNFTKVVAIHFVELGGDHLDRLACRLGYIDKEDPIQLGAAQSHSLFPDKCKVSSINFMETNKQDLHNHLNYVMSHSEELIADTSNIMYYVNCNTLFDCNCKHKVNNVSNENNEANESKKFNSYSQCSWQLNEHSFVALIRKLYGLSKCFHLQLQAKISFFCCRMPFMLSENVNCEGTLCHIPKCYCEGESNFPWNSNWTIVEQCLTKFCSAYCGNKISLHHTKCKLDVENTADILCTDADDIIWGSYENECGYEKCMNDYRYAELAKRHVFVVFLKAALNAIWSSNMATFCTKLQLQQVLAIQLLDIASRQTNLGYTIEVRELSSKGDKLSSANVDSTYQTFESQCAKVSWPYPKAWQLAGQVNVSETLRVLAFMLHNACQQRRSRDASVIGAMAVRHLLRCVIEFRANIEADGDNEIFAWFSQEKFIQLLGETDNYSNEMFYIPPEVLGALWPDSSRILVSGGLCLPALFPGTPPVHLEVYIPKNSSLLSDLFLLSDDEIEGVAFSIKPEKTAVIVTPSDNSWNTCPIVLRFPLHRDLFEYSIHKFLELVDLPIVPSALHSSISSSHLSSMNLWIPLEPISCDMLKNQVSSFLSSIGSSLLDNLKILCHPIFCSLYSNTDMQFLYNNSDISVLSNPSKLSCAVSVCHRLLNLATDIVQFAHFVYKQSEKVFLSNNQSPCLHVCIRKISNSPTEFYSIAITIIQQSQNNIQPILKNSDKSMYPLQHHPVSQNSPFEVGDILLSVYPYKL